MNHLVFFGAPYAGKGTQSKILLRKYPFVHISVGDILRNEIEIQSTIGKKVNEYVLKGTMVPNKVIMQIIKKHIKNVKENSRFIFDGIPRTMEQAIDFNQMTQQNNILDITFIKLNVSNIELLKRASIRALTDKRTDDQNNEVVNTRIKVYEEFTIPVINFYSQTLTIKQINGEQTIQKVHDDIQRIIIDGIS